MPRPLRAVTCFPWPLLGTDLPGLTSMWRGPSCTWSQLGDSRPRLQALPTSCLSDLVTSPVARAEVLALPPQDVLKSGWWSAREPRPRRPAGHVGLDLKPALRCHRCEGCCIWTTPHHTRPLRDQRKVDSARPRLQTAWPEGDISWTSQVSWGQLFSTRVPEASLPLSLRWLSTVLSPEVRARGVPPLPAAHSRMAFIKSLTLSGPCPKRR